MKFLNYLTYLFKNIILNFIVIVAILFFVHFSLSIHYSNNFSLLNSLKYIANILIFNYGTIQLDTQKSVVDLFNPYFLLSFVILFISFILSFIIGFLISYKLAKNSQNYWLKSINTIIFIVSSIPIFILGALLIILNNSLKLPIIYIDSFYENYAATILSLLVPILTLIIVVVPMIVAFNYPILRKIIQSQYYTHALAMSYSNRKIFFSVIVRNWIAQGVQNFVYIYIFLISFGMVIERFFYIPGQSFIFQYLKDRNYFNLLMHTILVNISIVFVIKSISDLVNYSLDVEKNIKVFRLRGIKWVR